MAVDVRNEFVDEHGLKLLGRELAEATEADAIGQTVGHHNDERTNLSISDEVIHDDIGTSLHAPCGVVLTPAVLQIEHGEALLLVLAVGGRCVDKCTAHAALATVALNIRGEEHLLQVAMRDIGA